MTGNRVKRINVALTYAFPFKGGEKGVASLLGTLTRHEPSPLPIQKSIKVAESFFSVNEDYTGKIMRKVHPARFRVDITYERTQRTGEAGRVTRSFSPTIIITTFPAQISKEDQTRVLLLSLLFDLEEDMGMEEATDLAIAIIQTLHGAEAYITTQEGEERQVKLEKYLEEVVEAEEGKETPSLGGSFACALAVTGSITTLMERYPCNLYGLLLGDEGWRDVPKAYAAAKLSKVGWSSRSYFRVLFSPTSLLLAGEYADREKREAIILRRPEWREYIRTSHSQTIPPILWHGLFLIYEWSVLGKNVHKVMKEALQSTAEEVRKIAAEERRAALPFMERKLKDIEGYTRKISEARDTLSEEIIGIPEVGFMMRTLSEEFGVMELGERLKETLNDLARLSEKLYQRISMKSASLQRIYFQIFSTLVALISLVALTPLMDPLAYSLNIETDTIKAIITLTSIALLTLLYLIKSRR